jgi:hypothetical protein
MSSLRRAYLLLFDESFKAVEVLTLAEAVSFIDSLSAVIGRLLLM